VQDDPLLALAIDLTVEALHLPFQPGPDRAVPALADGTSHVELVVQRLEAALRCSQVGKGPTEGCDVGRPGSCQDRHPERGVGQQFEHTPSDQIVDRLGDDGQLVAGATPSAHIAFRVVLAWAGKHPPAAQAAEDEAHQQVLRRRVPERQALGVEKNGPDMVPSPAFDRSFPDGGRQCSQNPPARISAVLPQAGDPG